MELFGLEGGALLLCAFLAWWWSESIVGFFFFLFILGTCFGGATQTEIGQKIIQETKVAVELAVEELDKPQHPIDVFGRGVSEPEEPAQEIPVPEEPAQLPALDFGDTQFE